MKTSSVDVLNCQLSSYCMNNWGSLCHHQNDSALISFFNGKSFIWDKYKKRCVSDHGFAAIQISTKVVLSAPWMCAAFHVEWRRSFEITVRSQYHHSARGVHHNSALQQSYPCASCIEGAWGNGGTGPRITDLNYRWKNAGSLLVPGLLLPALFNWLLFLSCLIS